MLKHQLVGRLGLILGICVLGTACLGGEVGDAGAGAGLGPEASDPAGGARLGPEASDPEIGNNASALVCPGASADVSASSGWRSSAASLPADGALRFEFKARPTAANLNGLVAVGAQDIDAFTKAAIIVRFAEDGFVDARDGAIYDSDVAYPYDPGVWYSVSVSADIQTETYDVEIGPCGEPQQKLIENASFRDDANINGQLSTWAVWSSQSAALEVSTPAWMASGSCVPSTCETLGQVCGQPSDGCGGALSCGDCGIGEICSSGICIDESVPPPPCQPATCQTLSAECGLQSDGCGGALSCGDCGIGEICSSGICIAEPVPPPPCQPATCQSLGAECGLLSDGCGGTLPSCGACIDGDICVGGTCSPPGVTGVPYGHVVPADVGNTIGVGVVASIPATVYTGDTTITSPGLIENVVINGCLKVKSDNVTLRNVIINCDALYPIYVQGANFLVEYSHIDCTSSSKVIRSDGAVSGMTVRNNELSGCQDFFFIEGDLDGTLIENNYMHTVIGSPQAHSDGFQIGEFEPTTGVITIRGNYFDPDNATIGKTDILFATNQSQNTILMENNFFHIWGWFTLRNSGQNSPATIRNNIYAQEFKTGLPAGTSVSLAFRHWSGNPAVSTYECNRYEDGTFIEQAYVSGATHVITGCPSY